MYAQGASIDVDRERPGGERDAVRESRDRKTAPDHRLYFLDRRVDREVGVEDYVGYLDVCLEYLPE